MSGYAVATMTYRIGAADYHIRSLSDRMQYWDPDGAAEAAGITSATWPMFGIVWPAGLALAQEMSNFAIDGLKVLEVGCGLGLASLVLQRRGAHITATDYHPLADEFLRFNANLNDLPPVQFLNAPWAGPNAALGRFDLIIGSDLLYERGHPALLASFLASHSEATARVIVADPGRSRCGQFNTKMDAAGFSHHSESRRFHGDEQIRPRGRMMTFAR